MADTSFMRSELGSPDHEGEQLRRSWFLLCLPGLASPPPRGQKKPRRKKAKAFVEKLNTICAACCGSKQGTADGGIQEQLHQRPDTESNASDGERKKEVLAFTAPTPFKDATAFLGLNSTPPSACSNLLRVSSPPSLPRRSDQERTRRRRRSPTKLAAQGCEEGLLPVKGKWGCRRRQSQASASDLTTSSPRPLANRANKWDEMPRGVDRWPHDLARVAHPLYQRFVELAKKRGAKQIRLRQPGDLGLDRSGLGIRKLTPPPSRETSERRFACWSEVTQDALRTTCTARGPPRR